MATVGVVGARNVGRIRRHPAFVAAVGLVVLAIGWFAVSLAGPVGPPPLLWLPAVASIVLLTVVLWVTARMSVLTPVARRFWRAFAVAGTSALLFPVWAAITAAVGPISHGEDVYLAVSIGPLLPVLWAFYRLPLGVTSRSERIRLVLDIATVSLAAVLFAWYAASGSAAGKAPGQHALISWLYLIAEMIVALAIAKVVLAGSRVLDPGVLRLLGLMFLSDGLASGAAPQLASRPHLDVLQVSAPVAVALVIAAALRQRVVSAENAGTASGRRRSFTVLPYVAVVAVDLLLLATLSAPALTRTIIAAAAVALTGIVIARQLAAFRENSRLLGQLAKQERWFRSLVQNAIDVILIVDSAGATTYASPGVRALTGRAAADWLGAPMLAMVHPDEATAAAEQWARTFAEPGGCLTYRTRIHHAGGEARWVQVTQTDLRHDPAIAGVVVNLHDITESYMYQQRLSYHAGHDPLTGLANRGRFGERTRAALARPGTRGVSLVLIDLDDFKAVNDTYGHHAGDELLMAVGRRLSAGARSAGDCAARLGGDEFALLLDDLTPEEVDAVVTRIMSTVCTPVIVDGHFLPLRASLGVADHRPGGEPRDLLRNADVALYAAKAAGKGGMVRHHIGMVGRTRARGGRVVHAGQAGQAGQ